MVTLELPSLMQRMMNRLFGSRRDDPRPSYNQVVRRATRIRAGKAVKEAERILHEWERYDPMELELLGKREKDE